MSICYFEIKIDIPDSHNLKEKRGIIKSIISRTSKTFNISIAEIEYNDFWQTALLGVAIVSNDGKMYERLINTLITYIEMNYPHIIISIINKEIL